MNTAIIEKKPRFIKPTERKQQLRNMIMDVQHRIENTPGAMMWDSKEYAFTCPLVHNFAEGIYTRQIFLPKGMLFVTKIHKFDHPYFMLYGDCSVLTDKGMARIKAPYSGITPAGTKRIIITHEDAVWVTCHKNPDNLRDVDLLEKLHTVDNFESFDQEQIDKFAEHLQIEEASDEVIKST